MTMPERITVRCTFGDTHASVDFCENDEIGATKYVRADKIQPLIDALKRFAQFGAMLSAMHELENDVLLEDNDAIISIMGSGASDVLTWKSFKEATEALASFQAIRGDDK